MEPIRAHKRVPKRSIGVRIKRRKLLGDKCPELVASESPNAATRIATFSASSIEKRSISDATLTETRAGAETRHEESKSTASTRADKDEEDREIMELLRETQNFDRRNLGISTFINDPSCVDVVSPLNNYENDIPLDEARPCSYFVRKQHYENMLKHFSVQSSARRPNQSRYFSQATTTTEMNSLLEYGISNEIILSLQTRELTPEDYSVLLALDSGLDPVQERWKEFEAKLREYKYKVCLWVHESR